MPLDLVVLKFGLSAILLQWFFQFPISSVYFPPDFFSLVERIVQVPITVLAV